jgi:hypothetical protein
MADRRLRHNGDAEPHLQPSCVNAGTPLKVRVTGLPTIEHVERHMAAVMNGTMSLDDIFHKVLLPRRT